MKVFVLSQEGKPLMPTTPRRARVWLKAKRARLVRQEPFTIRLRFATKAHVQVVFGESQVSIAYGYETKYKRIQVLDLPKSHTNDAVTMACEIGEVVKPLEMVHQIQRMLLDDAPNVFLYTPIAHYGVQPWVKNYTVPINAYDQRYEEIWLDGKKA